MTQTEGMWALRSITKVLSISEMAQTRPGQVSGSWFEGAESGQQSVYLK
jgi:hypothetical protein